MKWTAVMMATAAASLAGAAFAQTDVSGSAGRGPAASKKSGAMTIRQASGGGAPHAPRNARQPTVRVKHPSAGVSKRPYGTAHATVVKNQSGLRKGPVRPAQR